MGLRLCLGFPRLRYFLRQRSALQAFDGDRLAGLAYRWNLFFYLLK